MNINQDTLDVEHVIMNYIKEKGFFNLLIYSFSTNGADNVMREISVFVEKDDVFIFAMTVYEYEDKVYVEKIDSSTNSDKGLYSAIVQGVLLALNKRIHVFARAQPQLLFPESKNNSQKNLQTERKLVKWWARTLGGLQVEKGYYYVPGECKNTTRDIYTLLTKNGIQDKWDFGWPWKNNESVKVIPVFPDDPKYKCIKLLDDNSKIGDFESMLQITGECGSGRFSGFFILDPRISKCCATTITTLSNQDYRMFFTKLMNSDFSTREKAKESSKKLKEILKDVNVQGAQLPIQNDDVQEVSQITQEKKRATEVVILASNLIKKKKL